ncbi:MAG: phosphotransferase, partial [Planctomycetota bacterium]
MHGDLLGQNLLRSLDPEKQLGVIDWHEAQLGDPAYDLAVVTRGARKPFQAPDGLRRLLEAYGSCSNRIVTPAQVYLFELGLHAGFVEQARRAYGHRAALANAGAVLNNRGTPCGKKCALFAWPRRR